MKIKNFTVNEEKLRDLYLRKLALGEIQGPLTGIPSIDKKFLIHYTEEQIMAEMPSTTIYNYMFEKNLDNLDDIAIIYFGKKYSYRELRNQIDECAKGLQQRGIGVNDIVTVCMPNTPEAVIMFYALNKIGAVASMIHPLSSENEIKEFINEKNSKMVVTIDSSYSKVTNIMADTNLEEIVVVSPKNSMPFPLKQLYKFTKNNCKIRKNSKTIMWKDFIKLGRKIDKVNEHPYEKDKTSVIMHSGGTNGSPKGVELTDDNFNSMVEQFVLKADNFERGDRMLTVMPVFHGFGLCSSIHLPLSQGVATILIPKINIKNIDKTLNKYKPNHLLGVPTLFKGIMSVINNKLSSGKLKEFDLSYLKYVVSGGDAVKESFETEVNRFFAKCGSNAKLSKGYGLTEAVAGATFAYGEYNAVDSVGIPMVKTNVKIVDIETGEEVSENIDGEICIYGPTVMKAYYGREIETLEALKDGWLHTGDMGHIQNGILYFSQRKANMIISSGVNVYPRTIEEVIEKHPAVQQCAVIGIYHSYKNEVPKAFIVLKEGYDLTEEIKHEIEQLCHSNLNKYSIPYSYEYRESLPQTLLGKVSHNMLKQEDPDVKVKRYTK